MYRPTDHQGELFVAGTDLHPSARKLLEKSWASGFRRHIFPLLLAEEDRLAFLYDPANGRPNWSASRMAGLCLIQEWFDMTDRELEQALCFDVRFQHALDLRPDEAYLSRRSLSDFRLRLVTEDPEMVVFRELFDAVAKAAIKHLGLSIKRQRLDSTHVMSNIRSRGRADLFLRTLKHFIDDISRDYPDERHRLPKPLREWYEGKDEESWFGKGGERFALKTLAQWAVDVGFEFSTDKRIRWREPYFLVARLVADYCVFDVEEVETHGERVQVTKRSGAEESSEKPSSPSEDDEDDDNGESSSGESPPFSSESSAQNGSATVQSAPEVSDVLKRGRRGGRSLQSPHDPDASYGKRGLGYSLHVTETFGNENKPEIMTDFGLLDGADNDWGKSIPVTDRLVEQERAPDILEADAGYPTPEALLQATRLGITLHAPVKRLGDEGQVVGLESFSFDEQGKVVVCPEGHAPIRHATRREPGCDGPELHAYFPSELCANCVLCGRCVARANKGKQWRVRVEPRIRERDLAVERQKEPAWWAEYSARSGIEATMSELKRGHGLGRLRVRGRQSVLMRATLKITACNVKRWLRGVKTEATAQT